SRSTLLDTCRQLSCTSTSISPAMRKQKHNRVCGCMDTVCSNLMQRLSPIDRSLMLNPRRVTSRRTLGHKCAAGWGKANLDQDAGRRGSSLDAWQADHLSPTATT